MSGTSCDTRAAVPTCVVLVGSYPPPIGGISVHIQRLRMRLREQGVKVVVLDPTAEHCDQTPEGVVRWPVGWCAKVRFIGRWVKSLGPGTLVHYHVSALGRFKWVAPLFIWVFRRSPSIITFHSGSFVKQASRLPLRYLRWMMTSFDGVITVNNEQADFIASVAGPLRPVWTVPAYLSSVPNTSLLPPDFESRARGRLVIVTSGYLTPTYQYGPLLDVVSELDQERYLLLIAWYGEPDVIYAKEIISRANAMRHVLVVSNQTPETFISILANSVVYVRPTRTDGDCVAVREALALGKAVVASDAVKRPSGCLLFSVGDTKSLRSGLEAAFEMMHKRGSVVALENRSSNAYDENYQLIFRAYRSVLSARGEYFS